MTNRVVVGLPSQHTKDENPKFLCVMHNEQMWPNLRKLKFECQEKGCNQKIDFREIQQIAQWLKGYA